MRYLKRRRILPHFYDANAERYRVVESHRVKRCGTCTYEVPEADITVEDGHEVCPMCMDTYTAQWLAEEQMDVGRVKMDSARGLVDPPQMSIRALNERDVAAITSITDGSGNIVSSSHPLTVIRGGAGSTLLLLIGRNLSSAVTFPFIAPGNDFENYTAPAYSSTLITLSLTANALNGDYSLSVNDGLTSLNHVYPNILRVR